MSLVRQSLLCLVVLGWVAFGSSSLAKEGDASGPIRYKSHYNTARQLDFARLYSQSRTYYVALLDDFLAKHDAGIIREHEYAVIFPVVVSSVYRLAYANWKWTHSSMMQLSTQLESYQFIYDLTERVMASVMDVSDRYPDLRLIDVMPFLYYARAVTTLAWADTVMTGIMWKHYIVLPIQDIWAMVDEGLLDIRATLYAFDLLQDVSEGGAAGDSDANRDADLGLDAYQAALEKHVFMQDRHSVFYKTFSMIYENAAHDGDRVRQFRNTLYFNGKTLLDLNDKWLTKWVRKRSSSRLTIRAIVSLRNKSMFTLMDRYMQRLTPAVSLSTTSVLPSAESVR